MAQGLGFGVCRLKEGLVPLARPAVVWPSPMDLHQRLEHPPIPTPSPLSVTPCLLQKAPNIHDGVRWRLLHLRPDLRFYGVTEHVVLPKTISAPTKKTPMRTGCRISVSVSIPFHPLCQIIHGITLEHHRSTVSQAGGSLVSSLIGPAEGRKLDGAHAAVTW